MNANGGAAFPVGFVQRKHNEFHLQGQEGMSYHDWLVGKIVQGILASGQFKIPVDVPWGEAGIIAENALELADAIINKRRK